MMRKLFFIWLILLFTGAGCLNRNRSSNEADAGVFKSVNAGEQWSQAATIITARGIGTLTKTDVLVMEMDPQDPSVIYIGTRDDGLLYTEDAGASWRQPRLEALKDGTILSIEVDPNNVCTIYISKGGRLYKTTDCMRSFNSEMYVESRAEVQVVQIAVDWYSNNTLFIGLSNGDVLRSRDSGDTWQTVLKLDSAISDMLIHARDSRNMLIATAKKGVHRTTNGGDEWQKIESLFENKSTAKNVYHLIQDSSSSTVIASTGLGLLRSTDFGDTWGLIPLVTSAGEVNIRAVGMALNDPDTIYYATTSTFYRSRDGGETWQTERFPSDRLPRMLLVDPVDELVLYVGVAEVIK